MKKFIEGFRRFYREVKSDINTTTTEDIGYAAGLFSLAGLAAAAFWTVALTAVFPALRWLVRG